MVDDTIPSQIPYNKRCTCLLKNCSFVGLQFCRFMVTNFCNVIVLTTTLYISHILVGSQYSSWRFLAPFVPSISTNDQVPLFRSSLPYYIVLGNIMGWFLLRFLVAVQMPYLLSQPRHLVSDFNLLVTNYSFHL